MKRASVAWVLFAVATTVAAGAARAESPEPPVAAEPPAEAAGAAVSLPAHADTAAEEPPPEAGGGAPEASVTGSAPEPQSLLRYFLPSDVLALELNASLAFSMSKRVPQVVDRQGFEGGPSFSAGLTYRPDYFLSLFLDGTYCGLASTIDRSVVPSSLVVADNYLSMWQAAFGVLVDVWYFRGRFGLAGQDLIVQSSINGSTARSENFSVGYLFGLAGFFYREDGLQLGAELRAILNPASSVAAVGCGLAVSWDVLGL
jgi:hypothetical protein